MKIVCTAFVLMLACNYGCMEDELATSGFQEAAVLVEDITVEDVLAEDTGEPESLDVTVDEPTLDAASSGDAGRVFNEDVFVTMEEDVAGGLESDPTSFHSPSFQYVPYAPFPGR